MSSKYTTNFEEPSKRYESRNHFSDLPIVLFTLSCPPKKCNSILMDVMSLAKNITLIYLAYII